MFTRAVFVTVSLLTGCSTLPEDDSWSFTDGKGDGDGALSYGALALSKVPTSFDTTIAGLAVIDADVMPHEPKAVRKQLAELRDYLDLFAYAYPTSHGDPWKDIREELDDGYETIGEFKDMFDRQGVTDPRQAVYDPTELADKRAPVVAWTAELLAQRVDVRLYLAKPSPSNMHERDRDDLSQFFWGATKIEPSKSRSGLKNMAKLTRELLDLALEDYDTVLDVRDIHKVENQEVFHDFRKRIRSIGRMPGYFPAIMDPDDDVTEQLALLTEAVTKYGEINDLITKYAHEPDGDLKEEIADEWKALRDWQREHDFDNVLDDLHDAVRR
ncbi:MAG: hypothetical protein SFX73_38600 [Kofleriaceae bacterium]|nr:hypothetical protein [Kofleriaceae bacterium]